MALSLFLPGPGCVMGSVEGGVGKSEQIAGEKKCRNASKAKQRRNCFRLKEHSNGNVLLGSTQTTSAGKQTAFI